MTNAAVEAQAEQVVSQAHPHAIHKDCVECPALQRADAWDKGAQKSQGRWEILFGALTTLEESGNTKAMARLLGRNAGDALATADESLIARIRAWEVRVADAREREAAVGGPGSLLVPDHPLNVMCGRVRKLRLESPADSAAHILIAELAAATTGE